ncbi:MULTISPECIES: anthranilate synthase component II [Thermomonospora]|uniref:Glutamine amidotransferase of anthranilate synthase n=1 Tax=Thermomonospora curvata (strain ATCC 19995 / DSM 43183 / JCM 3096 / KCTC 9072 / NBRC 15933 / NCIMB 10081 / Henssen B9) TaxID=471852 RepID=D1ADG0_THECD|nr:MULTISPECIES: aminodeoxychorismate/anthranilate synthase component II [Thermomonospora]ACY95670.1 glutamine amidotransferase of anthranilate synthase [Thermomonospora curvata DSM 43183]PKK16264.1 MAG: aminodeoxychorismate/anthranilate synthase component II [Thermomonospora sp. CIF 1]
MSADGPRVLVVDNHDSFVFNIVQYLLELGADCVVKDRSDVTVDDAAGVHGVLLSPGPGHPADTGVCLELVKDAERRRLPLLGVCLGHQIIGHVYGAAVHRAPELVHGYTSPIEHDGEGVLAGLPSPFQATRYHSLAVDPASVPRALKVTARTPDGVVMGLRHRDRPIEGVQFHPESVLSECGHRLLANWLATCAFVP